MQDMRYEPNPQLTQRIMRRVYAVWFWRSVAPLLAVEAVLLLGVAFGVLTQISLRQIILNAMSASADVIAFTRFFTGNFFVKSVQSQFLAVAYVALAAFFIRDLRVALRGLVSRDELASLFVSAGGNRRLPS